MNRSLVLAVLAATAAFTLAVAGAGVARTQATSVKLTGALTSAQEVPAPTGSVAGARGTFTATATKTASGASLAWRLAFQGLTGPATAAHIHIAPRGEAGPVAVALCGPCESGDTGNTTMNDDAINAINNGRAYVNVHTGANQAGEVRAQVGIVSTRVAPLTAGQEVPKPKGNVSRARGAFSVTVTKTGTAAVLTWRLSFSGLTGRAVAAHIHTGRRGVAGPVALALCGPCRAGATGRTTLRPSLLAALEAGRAYVNIHTGRNPGGEIRGQIPVAAVRLTASASSSSSGGGDLYPGG